MSDEIKFWPGAAAVEGDMQDSGSDSENDEHLKFRHIGEDWPRKSPAKIYKRKLAVGEVFIAAGFVLYGLLSSLNQFSPLVVLSISSIVAFLGASLINISIHKNHSNKAYLATALIVVGFTGFGLVDQGIIPGGLIHSILPGGSLALIVVGLAWTAINVVRYWHDKNPRHNPFNNSFDSDALGQPHWPDHYPIIDSVDNMVSSARQLQGDKSRVERSTVGVGGSDLEEPDPDRVISSEDRENVYTLKNKDEAGSILAELDSPSPHTISGLRRNSFLNEGRTDIEDLAKFEDPEADLSCGKLVSSFA